MKRSTLFDRLDLRPVNPGVFCGEWRGGGPLLESISPINGKRLARVRTAAPDDYETSVTRATRAFAHWQNVPAPKRGEIIRQFGNALREARPDLARLVTLETGKILAEAEGEVQEMIDICDFATGLSRQLYGLTIASERPAHRLLEQWHPLGTVGIISAFNFPVAVWAWNSALAVVCGDATLWKPSEQTPLCAIAVIKIAARVCRANQVDPAIFSLAIGGPDLAGKMAEDARLPLISATGSVKMGRAIAPKIQRRFGRVLLELGGNNAVIVTPSANLDLALRAILFAAVGTAGQRCTTTRRLFVHESIENDLTRRLLAAYQQIPIGNPLEPQTLLGPLISPAAVEAMTAALRQAGREGGTILYGGKPLRGKNYPGGRYVTPCLVKIRPGAKIVQQETFAPILYLTAYSKLDDAIAWQNAVPQGLSSAIFTNDLRETELFLSARGSDCGIANVNLGTSGAEIGGAFGGEKETGGGRESGSDAWKNYMRRQTVTINYSSDLPLAQGIEFGISCQPPR
jgi:aldehyde dehydrogenase (NAD+)